MARRVVSACLREGALATRVLPRYGAGLDPRDADLAREISLGVLRNLGRLDFLLGKVARRPLDEMRPELLDLLRVALFQVVFLDRVPAHAAVSLAVDEAREVAGEKGAKLANALLRALLRLGKLRELLPEGEGAEGIAARESLPLWWTRRLVARYGLEETRRIARSLSFPPSVDLALDLRNVRPADVAAELRAVGFESATVPAVPGALLLPGSTRPPEELLGSGRAAVVDLGAQWVASLVPAAPGALVLDGAASPGGKAFVLGTTRPGIRLVAADRSAARIPRLRANLLSWSIPAALLVSDLGAPPFGPEPLFDSVLLDAPCSGSGTMRKNPEIRWRLEERELARFRQRQERILLAAARLVKRGGALVWSTCSLEPEENEQVVAALLAKGGWEAAPVPLPEGIPARRTGAPVPMGVRLLPGESNDGHTAFLLLRRA